MTMLFNEKKIFLVGEDIGTSSLIAQHLKNIGYSLYNASSIEGLEFLMREVKPDFLIIDTDMSEPMLNFVKQIRKSELFGALPIVVLTEVEDFSQKWNALSIGADGFLKKPIDMEELTLKIQALLRRACSYQTSSQDILYQNLKLSPLSGEVFIDSQRVQFTATEYKLLETLVVEKGRPVRRESLAHRSLTSKNPNPRTIDVHINAIRGKLGQIGRKIKTLRGKGYMLVD